MIASQKMANHMPSIAHILSDPSASLWLKDALRLALLRDPVDAANDSEFLAYLLARRCEQILSEG
jgi:hypothetical protein